MGYVGCGRVKHCEAAASIANVPRNGTFRTPVQIDGDGKVRSQGRGPALQSVAAMCLRRGTKPEPRRSLRGKGG